MLLLPQTREQHQTTSCQLTDFPCIRRIIAKRSSGTFLVLGRYGTRNRSIHVCRHCVNEFALSHWPCRGVPLGLPVPQSSARPSKNRIYTPKSSFPVICYHPSSMDSNPSIAMSDISCWMRQLPPLKSSLYHLYHRSQAAREVGMHAFFGIDHVLQTTGSR